MGGRDLSGVYDEMPVVHCHCFTREIEPERADIDIRKVILTLYSVCIQLIYIFLRREWKSRLGMLWERRRRCIWFGLLLRTKTCIALALGCLAKLLLAAINKCFDMIQLLSPCI